MIGDMFKHKILERGYHYFLDSRVYNVIKKDGVYYGQVDGSKVYDVQVKLSPQGKVSYITCNCPYATDGKKCKHEAAMLFHLLGTEKVIGTSEPFPTYDEDHYFDKYNGDDDEFDDYKKQYDIENEYYYEFNQFSETTLIGKLERMSKQEIIDILDIALKNQEVKIAFEDLLDKKQRVEKIEHMILQKMTQYPLMNMQGFHNLFKSLNELEKYDQIRDQINLAHKAMEKMLNIFPSMTNEQRKMAYDLFMLIEKHIDNNEYYQYIKAFETDLCIHNMHEFTHLMMDYIYKRDSSLISLLEDIEKEYQDVYSDKDKLANIYFSIVTHYEKDCFDRCVHNYYYLPSFQILLIDYYIDNNEFQKAIQVCNDAIEKKNKLIYHEKLIEIYKLTNQIHLLKEECQKVLFYVKPGDRNTYEELKRCYEKSIWDKEKVILLKKMSDQHIDVSKIYLNEKMYDELINYLISEDDILRIEKYENIFRKRTPQKLIKYYQNYIMNSLKETSTREFYKELMGYLKVIQEIDETKAQYIYHQLYKLYPKRKALMEELNKVIRK